jgi:hypothetical protein
LHHSQRVHKSLPFERRQDDWDEPPKYEIDFKKKISREAKNKELLSFHIASLRVWKRDSSL